MKKNLLKPFLFFLITLLLLLASIVILQWPGFEENYMKGGINNVKSNSRTNCQWL